MLKAKDLQDQPIEELEAKLRETRNELFALKNELRQTKKLEKPHLIREKKKDIAKILTVKTMKTNSKS